MLIAEGAFNLCSGLYILLKNLEKIKNTVSEKGVCKFLSNDYICNSSMNKGGRFVMKMMNKKNLTKAIVLSLLTACVAGGYTAI